MSLCVTRWPIIVIKKEWSYPLTKSFSSYRRKTAPPLWQSFVCGKNRHGPLITLFLLSLSNGFLAKNGQTNNKEKTSRGQIPTKSLASTRNYPTYSDKFVNYNYWSSVKWRNYPYKKKIKTLQNRNKQLLFWS